MRQKKRRVKKATATTALIGEQVLPVVRVEDQYGQVTFHTPDRQAHNDGRCLYDGIAWQIHPTMIRDLLPTPKTLTQALAGRKQR